MKKQGGAPLQVKATKNYNYITTVFALLLFFFVVLFGAQANAANSAELYLTSVKTQYTVGEHIYIKVRVNPGFENINVVRANLSYGSDVAVLQNYNIDGAWTYGSPGNSSSSTSASIGGFVLATVVTADSQFATLDYLAQNPGFLTITPENTSLLIDNNMVNQLLSSTLEAYTVEVVGAVLPPPGCEITNTCPPPPPTCEQTNTCPPPPPAGNNAPIINDLGEKIGYIGQKLEFTVSATDPDGDGIILSSTDLPNGASFDTANGKFSWTPNEQGIYSVTFTSTDNNANPKSSSKTVRLIIFCSGTTSTGGGVTCPAKEECSPTSGPICQSAPLNYQVKSSVKFNLFPYSTSHPNQNIWYASDRVEMHWLSDENALGYVFNLDNLESGDPQTAYQSLLDTKVTYRDVTDGRWFFHIKARYEDGWGATYHFKVNIDRTAPRLIITDITKQNGEVKLNFNATDNLSGVDYYQYMIDQGEWQNITPPLKIVSDKAQLVTIRAVDKASNVAQADVSMKILQVVGDVQEYSILVPQAIIIPAPIIDKVVYYLSSFDPFPNHAVVFSGTAEPMSELTVFFSHDQSLSAATEVNSAGHWEVTFKNFLPPGGYKVFAISKNDQEFSKPSEGMSFELKDGGGGETFAWSAFVLGIFLTFVIIFAKQALWKYAKTKN